MGIEFKEKILPQSLGDFFILIHSKSWEQET